MSDQTRAELLKGAPERRGISEFELRAKANGLLEFNGYAAVFDDPYTVTDLLGSFTEVVERNALKRTLSRNPDIIMNVNHSGLPLARSTSGTLRVGTDSRGYYVRADLEPKDPDVDAIRYKMERGDLTDMSWAFRVTVDQWDVAEDGSETRTIREVNVDGGDVSIVTTGANRNTTANLRSLVDAWNDFDALVEARDGAPLDREALLGARENLDRLLLETVPSRKTMSIRAAERALEL